MDTSGNRLDGVWLAKLLDMKCFSILVFFLLVYAFSAQDSLFLDSPKWKPSVTLHQRNGSLDSSACNELIIGEIRDSIKKYLNRQITSDQWIVFKGFSYKNVYNEYIYGLIDEKGGRIFRLKNLGTIGEHPLNHPKYKSLHNKVNIKKQNDYCVEIIDFKDIVYSLNVFFDSHAPEIHINRKVEPSDSTEMFFCFEREKNNKKEYFSHGYINNYFSERYSLLYEYDRLNEIIKKTLISDFSKCDWNLIIDK